MTEPQTEVEPIPCVGCGGLGTPSDTWSEGMLCPGCLARKPGGKPCANCGEPRDSHIRDLPRMKTPKDKKMLLRCRAEPGVDMTQYKAGQGSFNRKNTQGEDGLAWPLEMVNGRWLRKNRCPVCIQYLPPFYNTAGLKRNQGPTTKIQCNNCNSLVSKPKDWAWGVELDVVVNGQTFRRPGASEEKTR